MIIFEAPNFVVDDKPFFPNIIRRNEGNVEYLSSLDVPVTEKPVLWNLDLGLFNPLFLPLSEKDQYDALENKLLAFCQEKLSVYRERTLGVLLYAGKLEDVLSVPWDNIQQDNFAQWVTQVDPHGTLDDRYLKKQYACIILNDFLELITSGMPEQVEWFVLLDESEITDPIEFYQLTNKARYDHLHIFWKCPSSEYSVDFVWELGAPLQGYIAANPIKSSVIEPTIALCLPTAWEILPGELDYQRRIYSFLKENSLPHRPIAQEKISLDWQGLDYILVVSHQITPQGKRQLAGFAAAGGILITLGALLGLPNEQSFDTFVNSYATT